MDKNEAFARARDLENEYRAIVYVREILEAAVTAEMDTSRAKDQLTKLGEDIAARKVELDSLDADVKARSELAQAAQAKTNKTLSELAQALADTQSTTKEELARIQKAVEDARAKQKAEMDKAQSDAAEAQRIREAEYTERLQKLSKKQMEAEANLSDAQRNYQVFIDKVTVR